MSRLLAEPTDPTNGADGTSAKDGEPPARRPLVKVAATLCSGSAPPMSSSSADEVA